MCNSSRTLNQPFILPMVSLSVSKGRQKHNVNCLLLAFTDNGSDQVCIHGLIGIDIIQFMDMKTIKCMNGIAWEFPTGIAAPLGKSSFPLSGTNCPGESYEERPGEQLPDYHYRLFLLSQGASKFCFNPPQKNLPGCVFRMFK